MDKFKAEEKKIEDLFGKRTNFIIPSYQRPYSWREDEIEKFCEDIFSSFENTETDYFLSSIILVQDKKDENRYDVVDGQQRLTTISIFLSVLKEFLSEESKNEIKEIILKRIGGIPKIQRLKTDTSFYEDFQDVLVNFNIKDFENKVKEKEFKKNNFYLNSIKIYKEIEERKSLNLERFKEYFLTKIFLVKVHTKDKGLAFKLFEILNARGLPLKNSDLIKNFLIEKINTTYKEDSKEEEESFIEKWKEFEKKMKDLNEEIEDLLIYYIYYRKAENPKKNLFEEFQYEFKKYESFENFKLDFYKFSNLYFSLFDDEKYETFIFKKIQLMRNLREGRFWKTILLTFLMKNQEKSEFKELVKFCFKFYFINFFSRQTVNPYKQLSFDIIKSIKKNSFELIMRKEIYSEIQGKNFNIELLNKVSELYFEREIGNINEKLKKELNEDVYNEKFCKILLMILETETSREQEDKFKDMFEDQSKIYIEHIYPQNSRTEEKIQELEDIKNNLGNLTLLYGRTNSVFSNKNFMEKKELLENKYKGNNKFNITRKVFENSAWNLENYKERHTYMLKEIEKIFEIERNSLVE